jgi:hypothetical protein
MESSELLRALSIMLVAGSVVCLGWFVVFSLFTKKKSQDKVSVPTILDAGIMKEGKKEYLHILTITFRNSKQVSFTLIRDYKNPNSYLHYKYFYKWYFRRPQSTRFTFRYDVGAYTFLRKDIALIEYRVEEKK